MGKVVCVLRGTTQDRLKRFKDYCKCGIGIDVEEKKLYINDGCTIGGLCVEYGNKKLKKFIRARILEYGDNIDTYKKRSVSPVVSNIASINDIPSNFSYTGVIVYSERNKSLYFSVSDNVGRQIRWVHVHVEDFITQWIRETAYVFRGSLNRRHEYEMRIL